MATNPGLKGWNVCKYLHHLIRFISVNIKVLQWSANAWENLIAIGQMVSMDTSYLKQNMVNQSMRDYIVDNQYIPHSSLSQGQITKQSANKGHVYRLDTGPIYLTSQDSLMTKHPMSWQLV